MGVGFFSVALGPRRCFRAFSASVEYDSLSMCCTVSGSVFNPPSGGRCDSFHGFACIELQLQTL